MEPGQQRHAGSLPNFRPELRICSAKSPLSAYDARPHHSWHSVARDTDRGPLPDGDLASVPYRARGRPRSASGSAAYLVERRRNWRKPAPEKDPLTANERGPCQTEAAPEGRQNRPPQDWDRALARRWTSAAEPSRTPRVKPRGMRRTIGRSRLPAAGAQGTECPFLTPGRPGQLSRNFWWGRALRLAVRGLGRGFLALR
jgi:hypothetical protein